MKIESLLKDYMKEEIMAPGYSMAILKDGNCVYKKSYGYSNLENEVEINSQTNFYLASLSKSFTASAILLLSERGLLNLNDRVKKYFKEFPSCCEEIRILDLIYHRSGLPDYFDYYFKNKMNINGMTNKDVYNFVLTRTALNFNVGEKFQYSNTGYVLLSMIIETVSGLSYSQFLKDNFFAPLGMKNTYVFTEDKPIIPNRAYGYEKKDAKFACYDYYVLTTGDGGIYSSIDDLLLWMKSFDEERFFKKDILDIVFKSGDLNDGDDSNYGFGWFILQKDFTKVVFHSGQLGGFTNIMIKIPENKFSVLILTNYYRDSWKKISKLVHESAIEVYEAF